MKSTDSLIKMKMNIETAAPNPDTLECKLENRLKSSLEYHMNDKYIVGSKDNDWLEYRCDNYVEAVLKDANIQSENYLDVNSSKTVSQHIRNAIINEKAEKNTKKYSPELTEGYYVVFMNDGMSETLNPHTGILTVGKDGTTIFYHNSSNNSNHGVKSHSEKSVQAFQDWYDYNSFYYLKIEE